MLDEWAQAFAELVGRANAEGDVIADRDAADVGRLLVSVFMGLRQTTDVDDPERYFADLEKAWVLTAAGLRESGPHRLPQPVHQAPNRAGDHNATSLTR